MGENKNSTIVICEKTKHLYWEWSEISALWSLWSLYICLASCVWFWVLFYTHKVKPLGQQTITFTQITRLNRQTCSAYTHTESRAAVRPFLLIVLLIADERLTATEMKSTLHALVLSPIYLFRVRILFKISSSSSSSARIIYTRK